jgi:UDP-N-acetyl-2-amino-2-deoxyglucuronate dehydrogenase
MNQGVHTVDLMLWFMGRPVNIQAQAVRSTHQAIEVEDTVVATLTFENGAIGTLHATTAAFPGGRSRISVHGTEGGAEIEDDRLARLNVDGRTEDAPTQVAGPGLHKAQYEDIFGAIADSRTPGLTVQDGLEALATVRAVYIASTLQRPVKFLDVLEGRYDDVDVSRGVGLPR